MRPTRVRIVLPAGPFVPLWLQREFPFWLGLAAWSLLPTSILQWWVIYDVPVKSIDFTVVPLALFYVLRSIPVVRPEAGSAAPPSNLLGALFALVAYAAFSLAWSTLPEGAGAPMAMTLATTLAAACLGHYLFVNQTRLAVRALLWRLTVAITLIGALYSAESLFGLGLRSAGAPAAADFGIERVRGPLFEPSTGYIVLLPALAFAAQETLDRRVGRLAGGSIIFVLFVTMMGLGSRAGILLLAAFVLLSMVLTRSLGRVALLAILVAGCGAAAWYMVFQKASSTRLQEFNPENEGRVAMHMTAARALAERPLGESLLGAGYGAWWPWYWTEFQLQTENIYYSGRYTVNTPYGLILYHPHSTFLMLLIELGLAGALFALRLSWTLANAAIRCAAQSRYPVFAAGVAIATLSLSFDLFLFRRPTRDAVWWVFVFGLLALAPRRVMSRSPLPALPAVKREEEQAEELAHAG